MYCRSLILRFNNESLDEHAGGRDEGRGEGVIHCDANFAE